MLALWTRRFLFIDSEINVKSLSLKVNLRAFKDGNFSLNCVIKSRTEVGPSAELSLQNCANVSSLSSIDSNA